MDLIPKCFVCNAETDENRSYLNGLRSHHSDALITDFIVAIFADYKSFRNIEDETNCICGDCLYKIEEFDWTCLLAKRCEKELHDILMRTETECMNQDFGNGFHHMIVTHTDLNPSANKKNKINLENSIYTQTGANKSGEIIDTDPLLNEMNTENYEYSDIDNESSEEEIQIDKNDREFIPPRHITGMPPRKRGRPKTKPEIDPNIERKRGRPRKEPLRDPNIKLKRGRPRTRPVRDPNVRGRPGRPRTRPIRDPNVKGRPGRPRKHPKLEAFIRRKVGRPRIHTVPKVKEEIKQEDDDVVEILEETGLHFLLT